MKAPDILRKSSNIGLACDLIGSHATTEGVFYTERDCTSAREKPANDDLLYSEFGDAN